MRKFTALFAIMLCAFVYAAQAASVDDIIAQYFKAHGGEAAFRNVKTGYAEMEMNVMGMTMPMKMWTKDKDKVRVEQSMMGQITIAVINGKKGWAKTGGQVVELDSLQLEQQKQQMMSSGASMLDNLFLDYKAKGIKITKEADENVNGKDCYVLKIIMNPQTELKYFIDKGTGLETKFAIHVDMPKGEDGEDAEASGMAAMMSNIEVLVSEFKTFGEVKVPTLMTMSMGGMEVKTAIKVYEMNKAIDDKMFNKPE
jgi:hypothetical protein